MSISCGILRDGIRRGKHKYVRGTRFADDPDMCAILHIFSSFESAFEALKHKNILYERRKRLYSNGGIDMDNFIFHSPTKIIFGKDTELQAGSETALHAKKVLLHYGGGSVKKSGLYDRVKKSLSDAGVEFVELGGVQPNPRLKLVKEGIALCREKGIMFILAVGGGSVIDSAKAIAVGVPYSGDVWDFYDGKAVPQNALPVGVILTIPAAGSESSPSS
jgi:hypothetical protein